MSQSFQITFIECGVSKRIDIRSPKRVVFLVLVIRMDDKLCEFVNNMDANERE